MRRRKRGPRKVEMTAGNLIKYLQQFRPDKPVSFILANPSKRVFYEMGECILVMGEGFPVIVLEISGEEPFDEEMTKVAEECETEGEDE